MILGFRNCIDSLYLFENGTKTLVQLSQFWAGMDHFLWLIGEAVFHLGIPVGICWSVVRKMGGTPILGIVLGLTLVSSQLLNAYAVATTPADQIPHWDFGGFTVDMIGYQAQVLPAILAALTLVYLEKFFRKITPPVISMIVVPFCSLVLTVCAAHFVLGPIGWKIGSAISSVVFSGITGDFRVIFGAIFGFIYAPLVITGLHHMTNAIDLQLIADYHGTMLWPMIALSNIAQGSAVLAIRPSSETLLAPVSAKVAVLMEDSRHAVGLMLSNGTELLLHVGLDTVDMQGDGFEYLVQMGQEVKAGTPLLKFSREKIRAAGHEDVTVCIVTNKGEAESFQFKTGQQGKAGETVIASY